MSFRINKNNSIIYPAQGSVPSYWTQNNNNIFNNNNGNVGIGLTNPLYNLDISGSLKSSTFIDISNSTGSYGQLLSSTNTGLKWVNHSDLSGYRFPTGNTLTVDSVYGNDLIASSNINSYPFLTISSALSHTVSGNVVIVNAGVYNESFVIPSNISLHGVDTQAVIIQKLNVTQDTTLITMGNNCRLENITGILTSAGNYNLVGIDYINGSAITSKFRTSVLNVTSNISDSSHSIIGIKSGGISSIDYTSSSAVRSSTINIISDGSGQSRGILVNGPNRFSIRDVNIYARGNGTNIVGVEVTDISGVAEIKTSSVSGKKYDVNRLNGTLIIGTTDLVHNNANGNSFFPSQAPASIQFGIINGLGNNRRYYLVPGTSSTGNLVTDLTSTSYDVSKSFPFPFVQASLVIAATVTFTQTLQTGEAVTLFVYKNNDVTPSLTLSLISGRGNTAYITNNSVTFSDGDVMRCTLETTGTPSGTGSFSAIVGYY